MIEIIKHGPLSPVERTNLDMVGFADETERAATAIVVDNKVQHISMTDPDVEVLPIAEALRKYDWVQDLMFGLIAPDASDDVRRVTELALEPVGYLVHVKEGAKVKLPVQTFTLLETPQARQYVHDITVIEPNAEVEMISGDAVSDGLRAGEHVSISETYVREGARCRSLSIERWGEDMHVKSYSRTHIEKGAHVTDSSIALAPIGRHESVSQVDIEEDAVYSEQSIVFAPEGTQRISDTRIDLRGDRSSAESIARMVSAGGEITNRSHLTGDGHDTKGYLGCDGLKLSEGGFIDSSPSLRANTTDAQLSHEASIGMISEEKLSYLMASGLEEDQARELIVQGFLDLDSQQLPESIRSQVVEMVAQAKTGAL
ncbi:hypothetical protein F8O07_04660 [Pseudoclavibacter sp. CFCC 13796]|uniref:SufD family Fe-S cluster assembly protein n=1 Tax=Pseudoclavibacter sp. CFCC 13796 TaxID=2615179 RepID=UPI0013010AB2|nr:SufD family Fe-S cluster assembly protein [Pseudoclavibacter sp. CFCC 13796]KAB1661238.1 hypothetical protein F8O07_04660 [Pseudoclavibacter sp. CFCC 13796]